MKFKGTINLLFLVCLLQACGSNPFYKEMKKEQAQKVDRFDLYHLVVQDEIQSAVSLSNISGALGGGLLVALIDSAVNKSRANKSQVAIAELYDQTVDWNYRVAVAGVYNKTLDGKLALANKPNSAEAVLLTKGDIKSRVSRLKPREALLYLQVGYQFINGGRNVYTKTMVDVYVKPENERSDNIKPVYKNTFYYKSKDIFPTDHPSYKSIESKDTSRFPTLVKETDSSQDKLDQDQAEALALWAKEEVFAQSLLDAAKESAIMLAYDIKPEKNESCAGKMSVNYSYPGSEDYFSVGYLVIESEERLVFRTDKKALYSISKADVDVSKLKKSSRSGCVVK